MTLPTTPSTSTFTIYLASQKQIPYIEWCWNKEPRPVYCEFPDGLRFRSLDASGTFQFYTYTPAASGASIGTLPINF